MSANGPSESRPPIDVSAEGLKKTRNSALWINLATFLVGYATAVIAGALLYIRGDLELNESEQGLVTSVVLLGAMAAAILTGRMADRVGRKATLRAAGLLFAVGLTVAALATGFGLMMIGRLIMGLGVGTASALVPTYLREISPAQIRGRMLTLNQFMQTVGMLTAYVVNLLFSSSGDWRAMFWVGVVPAVLLVMITTRLPESPAWLISTGRTGAARDLIESVAGSESADTVVERYQREEEQRREQRDKDSAPERKGWRALLAPRVRPALVVGLGLAALQQFVGINTVLYYAPTIMEQTGVSASNSIIYSVIIGLVNLAMTFVSLRLVDRLGRRPLLLASLIGMGVSVAVLGLAFIAELSSVILLFCMLIYVSSFAIGMGPVLWVILPEVFPSHERAEGAGAGAAINWLANFAVSAAFLPLAGTIGTGQVFLTFAVFCLLALWFVSRLVPETKERDSEQIDVELHSRWRPGAETA